MSLQVRCACGYVGEGTRREGQDLTCPQCGSPLRQTGSVTSANVLAEVTGGRLSIRFHSKKVTLVESEQLIRIAFEDHADVARVLVDLKGVEYLGSSAVSALVRLAIERKLRLVQTNEKIVKTLQAMGLVSYFEFHPTMTDALKDF
ncbi:MAG: STAS domain-containing protein [Planctomycetales bacterium]|nr:STAS domain-containing protein [Planctomycetales bacterium]